MTAEPFRGTYTVLVTPFTADGAAPDLPALARLVEYQIANGVRGLIPLGSTGEFLSVSREERAAIVETVLRAAAPPGAGAGRHRRRGHARGRGALARGRVDGRAGRDGDPALLFGADRG
ncbi:dihydrodipicolinate synthase family protein [Pseudoroseomonas cervicalis]|uniref:dihydrodipicolinate synthase family protein n=1 Tax=Teichococcus cervicalis TaxID=204525 RepID=UPI0035EB4009